MCSTYEIYTATIWPRQNDYLVTEQKKKDITLRFNILLIGSVKEILMANIFDFGTRECLADS